MTFAACISCFCAEFSFDLVTLTFDLLTLPMSDELSFTPLMHIPICSILQLSIPELRVTKLCNDIWTSKTDWKQGIIIPLSKKGGITECNNWRGITLLSVLYRGKVFASIPLERIRDAIDSQLRQEQAGFRPGRSCNDQILRQIIEKVTAWQRPVMTNFIDFKKAFDCIIPTFTMAHYEEAWYTR